LEPRSRLTDDASFASSVRLVATEHRVCDSRMADLLASVYGEPYLPRIYGADDNVLNSREVSGMRVTVILFLVLALVGAPALVAAEPNADSPFQQSVARSVQAAGALAQGGAGNGDGNPYVTPALVMIAAGAGVAIMGSTMPQLRTQTDDYDLCAAAHGGPTGPSTRNPACDDFRRVNKGMLWTGVAFAAAGAGLLTIGAIRNVTVYVRPGGAFVGKTARF
jgi:hypothetical protein